eukprot:TRINITY_DN4356_c0_g1_i1.p1 TRINITY_DN4356_c0_g1~~TRINITY_DN4356_c0_g1_i1.p1  ORF type:complete len:129 (+),score=3.84 TRINITY_DN4356_c0_g1_i1:50-436(+)
MFTRITRVYNKSTEPMVLLKRRPGVKVPEVLTEKHPIPVGEFYELKKSDYCIFKTNPEMVPFYTVHRVETNAQGEMVPLKPGEYLDLDKVKDSIDIILEIDNGQKVWVRYFERRKRDLLSPRSYSRRR